MLIAFWLLLILYIGLTLLYTVTKTEQTKFEPWPLLLAVTKQEPVTSACKYHADCPSTHVCLGNECVPKLLRVNNCNPLTGQWISYVYQGVTFAICVCLKPHLMNQKYFGGNCDVNVGCGIHGRYLADKNICECDPGYKAVGLTCQKMPAVDYLNLSPCVRNEIQVSAIKPSNGFHDDYIKSLSPLKCVKRPCSFDALSGRPIKRSRSTFVEGWGCVCDPRYGLYGVVLDGANKNYLNTPGYDACASIFTEEPQDKIDVQLITYFYLGKRDPISLIFFKNLNEEDPLITPLKGTTEIMMGQPLWQYDYAQHFFDTNRTFRARTRTLYSDHVFSFERVNEWYYEDKFKPVKCNIIPNNWTNHPNDRSDVYALLYRNPVCRVQAHDPHANPMFWNKVVVNPHHITFKDHANLFRGNAFALEYEAKVGVGRWTLDLDHGYKTDTYMSIITNAPTHPVNRNYNPHPPYLEYEGF